MYNFDSWRRLLFQLLKIAFDEEVTPEKVEMFVNDLDALRWPETVTELFPIANAGISHPAFDHAPAPKNKFGTIRSVFHISIIFYSVHFVPYKEKRGWDTVTRKSRYVRDIVLESVQ